MKRNLSRNIFHPGDVTISPSNFKPGKVQAKVSQKGQDVLEVRKRELLQMAEEREQLELKINNLKQKREQIKQEIFDVEERKKKDLDLQTQTQTEMLAKQREESIEQTKKEIAKMLAQGDQERQEIIEKGKLEEEKITEENRKIGHEEGFEQGYAEGKEERKRIEVFLKKILNETINKRDQIVDHLQQHLIDVILLIAKKVTKKIAEKDEMIVVQNIHDCLQKIQGPIQVKIRVNVSDFKTVTKFKARLIKSLNSLEKVDIVEDPTIDRGGCMIETDFVLIDGRVSSQLEKIEKMITATRLV